MKIAVRYYTKTGNTREVAEVIANTLGVQALPIEDGLPEEVDVLFLGSAAYAGGVDRKIRHFISELNGQVKEIVNFSTTAIIKSTYEQMKKITAGKGIRMSEKEFHCRGSFTVMHKGRPNADDLKKAEDFARSFVNA